MQLVLGAQGLVPPSCSPPQESCSGRQPGGACAGCYLLEHEGLLLLQEGLELLRAQDLLLEDLLHLLGSDDLRCHHSH